MSASNIQVAIKVRPILRKEKEQKQSSSWKVAGNSIQLIDGQPEPFYFDQIFDQDVCNQVIFDTMAKQIVDSGLKGFNGTIFAYGQTSSGKTYTMMGDEQNPGVMVLASKEIFKEIERASDRQFLVRVGYIEIYNEKIYDLLNKSNVDLKIHETPNGDVSVNCTEYIITCEEDLLSYLCLGSKQRKIGETNMNERSSRSHAIFRIIIESRQTDKTDEDSVQISILNLVDLAGSERADQSGATGSRLKEGAHINKSLLFLSRVIKQLAEDKYVSYRDSKLTRILQASLGGNALTAIICTINPTAVEETLSTLSFANRAKAVKNTPQVNEILTDAAMMKRLEKEIYRLQNELEVEKIKNSQIKVGQLQKRLNEEILKIINSNSSHSVKIATEKRRRTWCPSSVIPPLIEEESANTETGLPQPTMATHLPTKLQLPKAGMNFTPHITLRDVYYQSDLKAIEGTPPIEEEFFPAEDVCFDDMLTPRASPSHVKADFQTPTQGIKLRTASLTPRLTEKESLQKVERELKELEAFTNLENKLNVEHDTYNTLKYKLENAERIIARYEKEREDFAFIKVEHVESETKLAKSQKRCEELESKITDLESKVKKFEEASKASTERVVRYEKEVTDLKSKITQLEMENREAVSLEFEFQQHKTKSKLRETELLDALEEKQKEINRLNRSLQTLTTDVLNNSKDELQQKSLNESGTSACVKCDEYQRKLSAKEKDFDEVNSSCQVLKADLEKISSEAESEKLRADSLQTENNGLKKDAEHLKSLHGSLDEVQRQIAALQAEKCKLESVKIEFEVMSKETANKIAEKINISQEIHALTAQRENLAAECDKLSAEIADKGSAKDELDKLRTENNLLRTELGTIKAKLETVQSDYHNLMTENQSKSDYFDKLNSELLSVQTLLHTVQSEYHDIQLKYEQIQAECNKHEGTIGEIQSEYDSIQIRYQSLQKEYEKLENDSVQSIADCDRVQSQNENLETEIRELKTKVEEAQRKLLENDSLQLELESLKSEMNRLQGQYDKNMSIKIKSSSPNKEEHDADLRQENAKLKHDLENLQQRFDDMQKEYDDISTQLVDTFADYETLQAEVARLENELKQSQGQTVLDQLADDFKCMKVKTEQLVAENVNLAKENAEWKKTVLSMTESMRDKCDEREQLVAQLEQVKNESLRSEPADKPIEVCEQFLQMAESIVEIEIPAANGSTRMFLVQNDSKSSTGSKMIIGNISDITQGTFKELRGAIEFVISSDGPKSGNEIYDSLEGEENSTSANSCDSLDADCKQPTEVQVNELIEEKAKLYEKIRDLEQSVAVLKSENAELISARAQLDETLRLVDNLNSEKLVLTTICEESKCKINELNEIISRAESDNKKLIADCEQLKKTVEAECAVETVSRETYEELERKHKEVFDKLKANEKMMAESDQDYEEMCTELRGQLMALKADPSGNAILAQIKEQTAQFQKLKAEVTESECKCEEYKKQISTLDAIVNGLTLQMKKFIVNNNGKDMPVRAELEETIGELHEQLKMCKCVELQVALDLKTQQLAALSDTKAAKYEQDICALLEQLKQQECKCQEVQIEIIELKTALEEKVQESAESLAKFEELNGRYTKLQLEHEELQRALDEEKSKSNELQKSVQKLEQIEKESMLMQASMRCMRETIESYGDDRNEAIRQKETIEKEYNELSDKLIVLEDKYNKLKNNKTEVQELNKKLDAFKEKNAAIGGEKIKMKEELQKLEHNVKTLTEKCVTLKNSERSLHGQLQRLVQDHELSVRDKEKLERECHISRTEIDILKKESEAQAREKQNLQQRCDDLKAELNNVEAEKAKLKQETKRTKEELGKVLEDYAHDKKTLEDKCSSLHGDLHDLTTTILELQSSLDKSEKQCEFLLEQSKEMEEQFNLELCSTRNSNNSMAQQIEELHEKLEKAQAELKATQESGDSANNELVIQLTNNNNTLATTASEQKEKLALFKQKLDETKSLVEILQKDNSEKDDLITELTSKNTSLTTKSSEAEEKVVLLEREIDETKRSLSTEVHLKEVLEKANTERDDLIVQLTNNNNSLATKSSELEEKLAILGNQFEESKRHLSTEVAKLTQLLSEATEKTTAQNSKIEDLTQKIEDLKGDLEKTQNAATERDSLLQKFDQVQAEYDSLAIKHANLELTRSSFEAELNSARAVVVENTALSKQLKEMESTLKEMQIKCDSLSADNADVKAINLTLVQQLEAANGKISDCKVLNDEIEKLKKELEKAQVDLSKSKEQHDKSSAEWNSKKVSFMEEISTLQSKITTLMAEKKALQKKLENAETVAASKIAIFEHQIQSMQKDQNANLSKSISPKRDKAIDHLMGENHQLKVKNMSLMDKLDSCQKSQNEERKNRRLSTHDERRFQSFWDSNRDVSTMTEPTNVECSCSELDQKLNELKQRLLIRDSQVNTLSMELKNHPLKTENATLKKLLIEEESKQQQLRQEIKKYKQLIVNRTNESRHCAKCAEASKRITVHSSTQTTESDESECYRKLQSKYEDLKMICRVRHIKIKELEDALSTGKENATDNFSSVQQYRQKYELLKKEFKTIQEKYEEAKTLCNIRYEQIRNLSSQLSGSG